MTKLVSAVVGAALALVGATELAQAAQAKHEHWCLRGQSSTDCSYNTLAQCKAARGAGGYGTCSRARRPHPATPGAVNGF
jgi:hypothetical protein